MNRTTMRTGMVAAAMLFAAGASAQLTTNAWLPTSGSNDWSIASNWDPASVPGGTTAVAIFTNDYAAHVTNWLSSDVTVNGLHLDDAGAADAHRLIIQGKRLVFDGTSAFIVNSNSAAGAGITLVSTTLVQSATLSLYGRDGGGGGMFGGPLTGSGTLLIRSGGWAVTDNTSPTLNSNFTGRIVVSNDLGSAVGAMVTCRAGSAAAQYWCLGSTNEATYIYHNGAVQILRNGNSVSNAEPFHFYGVHSNGSIQVYASTNVAYFGTVTLHTNGVLGMAQYFGPADAPIGARQDVYFNGRVVDDGGSRNLHFIRYLDNNSTGTLTRLSRWVLGGEATHGGFTHVTDARAPIGDTQFTGWLELTNGNDRLPIGTALYLGGRTNSDTLTIGNHGANGALVLAGANQELAGLRVLGTGSQSRVIGGAPTNNTLTLNIAGGTTNLYRGYLGGAGVNENNLALTKKGDGYLHLTNANTATGPTTIEAGTLRIGGSHAGDMTVKSGGALAVDGTAPGLITVENGGTLGGIGTVGDIASAGTVAPGNSVGTLTANGDVTLGAGATLQIEINEFLGDDYDQLVLSGGTLSLSGSPDLAITLNYVPGMGDAFTIVSGMTGFDPGFDGTFSGKPDLGTFDVSGTTLQIDYSATDITLTVVPEPHTLGLLGLAALGGLLRRRIRG